MRVGWFRRWRRARILRRERLDRALWRTVTSRYPFVSELSAAELARLSELVILFLHEKAVVGAGGMRISEEVRLAIAVQACILILNLDLDYYRGWVEVIVYPDEFVARHEFVDEAGVAHVVTGPMSGESWEGGPVIVSWADAEEAGRGGTYNVVIHEFAHKLDMLNGQANGYPALHAGMSREKWAQTFERAYSDFCTRVDLRFELPFDPYASESPAEFFAVVSEAFFESPLAVKGAYPAVYEQLAQFYRQDPARRRDRQGRERTLSSAPA
jgi:MtfA peptidase